MLFCNPDSTVHTTQRNVLFSNDDTQLNASVIFDWGTCMTRTAILSGSAWVCRPVLHIYRAVVESIAPYSYLLQ